MAMTADRLLVGIKRRAQIPSKQASLSDEDMLAFADDIISSRIVPLLESVNQDFFVTKTTIPLVASQSEYQIPYRAVGRSLRELKIADTNDNVRNLALISIEDAYTFSSGASSAGFYFIGDNIRLVPDVPSTVSQTLHVWYRLPPSQLVTLSSAARVTGVSGDDVTVDSVPDTMIADVDIDFVQGKSGSTIYSIDQTITNVSGTTLTFAADTVPSQLTVGDYVSMAGTSPVINFVPNECYSLIESLTAQRILNALSDFEGAKILAEDVSIEERNVKMLLEPRIDGEPTIIINRSGLVRGGRANRSWLFGQ